jgi:hypothetical protein
MYVVGATVLSDFWRGHPQCEAELRALHALLADAPAGEMMALLGGAADSDGSAVMIDLSSTRVSLEVNEAAQVVRVAGIEAREVD